MIQIAKSGDLSHSSLKIDGQALIKLAQQRMRQGLAPPPQIYRIEYRNRIDWSQFPDWARPIDPQLFDGCCHEG
jgi:hypothetical protein